MKISDLKKDTLIIVATVAERKRLINLFKKSVSPIPNSFLPTDKCPNIYVGLFNHRFTNNYKGIIFHKKIKSETIK